MMRNFRLNLNRSHILRVGSDNRSIMYSLLCDFSLVGFDDILYLAIFIFISQRPYWILTLIMITRVDLNSVGFAEGSSTVEEDWKDWKRPVISRDRAKLFLNKT